MNASTPDRNKDRSTKCEMVFASPDGSPSHSVEGELSSFLPHLARMSTQLQETSRQIESSVINVCSSFQDIAARARAAVERTRDFLTGGSDQDRRSFKEVVSSFGRIMQQILKAAEESNAVSQGAIERIHLMETASEKIEDTLVKLDSIAMQNKLLAINARIEAAHAGKAGAGFSVVATEVASHSERSRALTSEVHELVENLRDLAENTIRVLRRSQEEDLQRLTEGRDEVNDSLRIIQEAHRKIEETLSAVTDESFVVANDIGGAVRGLQFQDRVNQQIAHVIGDLDALRAGLNALSTGDTLASATVRPKMGQYTMYEERAIAGCADGERPESEIELF